MTNEAKDLRSALLLEQASYCYLLCNPPLVRKYSFHVILSGYRFSKSGQKKHSSRTYRQGFQVGRIRARSSLSQYLFPQKTLNFHFDVNSAAHRAISYIYYSTLKNIFLGIQKPRLGISRKSHLVHFGPPVFITERSLYRSQFVQRISCYYKCWT